MLSGASSKKIYAYSFLTLGCYFFYWCSHSRTDIHNSARQELIPSTWLLGLPFGNYWWMWQYANAIQTVSYGRIVSTDTFLLYILVSHAWLLLGYGGLTFTWSGGGSTTIGDLMPILAIYVIISIALQIAGTAFFCATIQRKINRLQLHERHDGNTIS